MLSPRLSEFYFITILVFLSTTPRDCSRIHSSFPNHSGGTAQKKFDSHSLAGVHLRVTRSDDGRFQSTMPNSSQDYVTNQLITNKKVSRKHKLAEVSSTKKYVVVFDIDECLCSSRNHKYSFKPKAVEEGMRAFPECPVIPWEYKEEKYFTAYPPNNKLYIHSYVYFFLPHLKILFDYLLGQSVRIVFFSAGIKERNDEVIPKLLKLYWGSEKYETFRSQGQFIIFSKDDLIKRCVRDPTDEKAGEYVKDLCKVIRDGETLSDIILVDDDSSYACSDQKPLICVSNIFCFEEALNSIYYMYGLFKTYFENKKYNKLPLREGINKILSKHKLQNDRYFQTSHPFSIQMINFGLLEVQKLLPQARLYVHADTLPQSYWYMT